MPIFTLASRATREFISLIKRGKRRDDLDNYPAIKQLAEENTYFGELSESLSSASNFYPITQQQRESAHRKMIGELRRCRQIRHRRRTIGYAASFAGLVILAAAIYVYSSHGQREVISHHIPAGKYAVPQIVLSSGERVDLITSEEIADGDNRISNHDNRLVYGQNDQAGLSITHKLLIPEMSRHSVVLSDGTEVLVNANSEIEYLVSFGAEERRVLLEGEAFFKVSKDARPFIVECSGVEFEVFGTSFNVNGHNRDQVTAVLVSGSIGVKGDAEEYTMVRPNQAVEVGRRGRGCRVFDVDVAHYTGWMNSAFVYDNAPLWMLLNDMASWYGLEFRCDTRLIDGVEVTVKMDRNQSAEKIMKDLSTLLNIEFKRKEDKTYEIAPTQ